MPKKFLYILILLMVINSVLFAASKRPEWISDPYSQYPASNYLCAVGTGKELKSAQNDALKNIAGFFETRVTAVTKSMESETTSASGSEINSSISTSVKAISEGTIKFTEIKETYQDPNTNNFYALAVLNKKALLALYEKEIVESEDFIANCLFKVEDPLLRFAKLCQAIDKYYATQNAFVYYNALAGESGSFLRPACSLQELKEMRSEAAQDIPFCIIVKGDSSASLEASLLNVFNQMGLNNLVEESKAEFRIYALLTPQPQKTIGKQFYQPFSLKIHFLRGDKLLFSFVDKTEQGGSSPEEAISRGIKVLAKNIETKFNKEFTNYLSQME
ncbi:MAG: LPP20 family lipoprotein [Candidatus Cloacimonas sp.]